ncbi:TPA: hypothetical protein ACR3S6_005332, partial [Bacillus thuringiensis]
TGATGITGPTGPTGATGETGAGFTPVFGSLITDPSAGHAAIMNTNVDFDIIGPFSGVIPDITDNSITINSSGVYNISFSTGISAGTMSGGGGFVGFLLTINGIAQFSTQIQYAIGNTGTGVLDQLSRTDQLLLNQGDVLRIRINAGSQVTYFTASFVVTKVN